MKQVVVTTSWDDGHKLDVRLAELLKKYDIKGTFYIAPKDWEFPSGELLTDSQVKTISESFEIGAHTITHRSLPSLSNEEACEEIQGSKKYLEQVTGEEVRSFCYPRGEYRSKHVQMVREAGYTYARTVNRHSFTSGTSLLEAVTTIHTYNHYSDLWKIAKFANFNPVKTFEYFQWDTLAKAMFDQTLETGGVYHLWGHSWEIEKHGDWEKLENVLAYISRKKEVQYATNDELNTVIKNRVLIVSPYFPPYLGGTQLYVCNIAKRLQDDLGWEVCVATSGKQGLRTVEENYEGLKLYRMPYWFKFSNTPVNLWWPIMLKRIIKRENISIINAHMPVPIMGDMARMVAGTKPFILTYHAGKIRKTGIILSTFAWLYENMILRATLDRANLIICSSDFVRYEFLQEYLVKSITITPAVDSERFLPGNKKSELPTVLFVAGLTRSEEYKGLRILLEALRLVREAIPNARLSVVGEGNMKETYLAYAKQLGISDAVDFHGQLGGNKLVQQYQHADVFVLPSLNESFGMVVLEAMSCALPVIADNLGGLPLLVEDNENGFLIEPQKVDILSQRLITLLTDHELASKFGRAGRLKAIGGYNWNTRARQYDQAYRKISAKEINSSVITLEMPASENITVVILTYNSVRTIRECLDSLVRQTNQTFKVLIVDDDSTDGTREVIRSYVEHQKLCIEIVRNGTHIISKGRNIGIQASLTDIVAFLDSDDSADSHWIEAIVNSFKAHPEAGLLSGPLLPDASEAAGRAIAVNDSTIRRFFGNGVMLFCTANSAFNKRILKLPYFFDEDFIYAEDLEIASRIQKNYTWTFVPQMVVYQKSRETLREYAVQMYRYGKWKMYYGFVAQQYRPLDFIPLAIGLISIAISISTMSWLPLLILPVFCFLEFLFVILITRAEPKVLLLTLPAWIVKNFAWSAGITVGAITLISDKTLRTRFSQKRI